MARQIGILGGSFNPVHIGHLMLASYLSQYTSLDEVWLTFSPQNPLKNADMLIGD
ncbi:MAG: nicotinic acid mononucleotide adenylyltransferase, partial [Muribaculaceae bacterium]|nr:nicotinic acid mononucleotide adenylyltransferase [Muribaculaceae bacterium]